MIHRRFPGVARLLEVLEPRRLMAVSLGAPFDTGGLHNAGGIVVADFDGDGKLDAAAGGTNADGDSGCLAVYRGNGDGSFQPPTSLATAGARVFGVAAGDFNGDGKTDLVAANSFPSIVSFFAGHGDGTFADVVDSSRGGTEVARSDFDPDLTTADLNGDGKLELIVFPADF